MSKQGQRVHAAIGALAVWILATLLLMMLGSWIECREEDGVCFLAITFPLAGLGGIAVAILSYFLIRRWQESR